MFSSSSDIGLIYWYVMARQNDWDLTRVYDDILTTPAQEALFEGLPLSGRTLALEAKESFTESVAALEARHKDLRQADGDYQERGSVAFELGQMKRRIEMVDWFLSL